MAVLLRRILRGAATLGRIHGLSCQKDSEGLSVEKNLRGRHVGKNLSSFKWWEHSERTALSEG